MRNLRNLMLNFQIIDTKRFITENYLHILSELEI